MTRTIKSFSDFTQGIDCIDLFCGVGGLTNGLIKGGIRVLAGIDIDFRCKFPYEENNQSLFVKKDISSVTPNELNLLFNGSNVRLLAACAPCQPFSTYSRSRKSKEDNQWSLIRNFSRLIQETQPDLIAMENVPRFIQHKVFQDFLLDLRDYHIWFKVIQCIDYGVPQTRKRLVLLGSKYKEIELLSPSEFGESVHTVRQAIGHLPVLSAGGTEEKDPLHTTSKLSELNLRRIQASKPGGTWRDWDNSLIANCHRKNSGQTYPSVYGRMKWDEPSPTITTQCFGYGNGRFGHPEQDRAISLREAALLQTFPQGYKFLAHGEKAQFSTLGRLIGNAVPVKIGEVIAKSFIKHVKQLQEDARNDVGTESFNEAVYSVDLRNGCAVN